MNKPSTKLFIVSLFASLAVTFSGSTPDLHAVTVKYRGQRNLSEYQCHETKSSFVHRLCFKPSSTLANLNTSWYEYCNLPRAIFDAWLNAPSKGRYLNQDVKGTYDCRTKMPVDEMLSTRRGCCSHHRGVCGCSLGVVRCCDGWLNSSCACR